MHITMDIFYFILLGLIQGFTEILPVSSSGHLVLFQHVFGLNQPNMTFEIVVNTGSLLAVIAFYWTDIKQLIIDFFSFLVKRDATAKKGFITVWLLALASIPIGLVGFLLKDSMSAFKSLTFVGITLMMTGTALFLINRFGKSTQKTEVTLKEASVMGLTQVFAIFPGISRSGSTIVGGLATRLDIKSTLKFSFLMYIPVSIATAFLGVFELINQPESIHIVGYSLAFIFSGIATYIAIHLLIKIVKVGRLHYFGIYCLCVGALALILGGLA